MEEIQSLRDQIKDKESHLRNQKWMSEPHRVSYTDADLEEIIKLETELARLRAQLPESKLAATQQRIRAQHRPIKRLPESLEKPQSQPPLTLKKAA